MHHCIRYMRGIGRYFTIGWLLLGWIPLEQALLFLARFVSVPKRETEEQSA